MTDYSKMIDFEINKLVALSIGGFESEDIFQLQGVIFKRHGKFQYSVFDPCNNPSDAWPIIYRELISLSANETSEGNHKWFAFSREREGYKQVACASPLRAAMIVYLMMKESDSAQG